MPRLLLSQLQDVIISENIYVQSQFNPINYVLHYSQIIIEYEKTKIFIHGDIAVQCYVNVFQLYIRMQSSL